MRERGSSFGQETLNQEFEIPNEDMWAKKNVIDTKTNRSGYKVRYDKSSNYVQWLVDGAESMYEMCDAFCKATKFIYIISAYFSPGINLARGNDYDKIYNKHRNIIDKVRALNHSKGVTQNTIPLVSLLSVKARDIPVRIVMFRPDTLLGIPVLNNFSQEVMGGVFGWKEAFEMVRNWSNDIDVRLARWGGTTPDRFAYEGFIYGGHHQKSAIAATDEGLIGFCGGVDFAFARWALPSHNLVTRTLDIPDTVDPSINIQKQESWIEPGEVVGEWDKRKKKYRSSGSQVLWHDVHAKVVGPAALDLTNNFVERYRNARTLRLPWNRLPPREYDEEEIRDYGDQNQVSFDLLDSQEDDYSREKIEAQTIRSYKTAGDYGIWDAYRNLFSNAKRNIYIESQYAFEDSELKNKLLQNLKNNKSLRVIIVAPVKIGHITGGGKTPFNYNLKIEKNLLELIKASTTNNEPSTARVAVFSAMSAYGNRRVPIYVHSKIAVVDDEWSIVGSANLDEMGMGGKGKTRGNTKGSSELGILVRGKNHALALRKRLAKEHHQNPTNTGNSNDFDSIFSVFIDTATKNGKPNDTGPLTGHLVFHKLYHNFGTPSSSSPSIPGPLPSWDLRNRTQNGQGSLAKGDSRKDLVKQLQKMLLALGYDLDGSGSNKDNGVDGIFGKITYDAVIDFQESHEDFNRKPLAPDGLVGPLTSDSINRAMLGKWYNSYTVNPFLVQYYDEIKRGKKIGLPIDS